MKKKKKIEKVHLQLYYLFKKVLYLRVQLNLKTPVHVLPCEFHEIPRDRYSLEHL